MIEIAGVKKTRVKHHAGILPFWSKDTRTFGEADTIRPSKDSKVCDQGVTKMFPGHAEKYERNCYIMCNPPQEQCRGDT